MILGLKNACCHGNTVPGCEWLIFIPHLLQVFEKFTKESTSLLDELSIINESDKSSSVDKDKYACTKTHARTKTHIHTIVVHWKWTDEVQNCVSVSSAGQLTASSCLPLTLRLSFRLVNITLFHLSPFQTCTLLLCVSHVVIKKLSLKLDSQTQRANCTLRKKNLSWVWTVAP